MGIALVTGASSGMGAAFAQRLAAQHHDVLLVARREERLKQLACELKQRHAIQAEFIVADLATGEGIERVEKCISELDALEFLVNNAGFAVPGRFSEIPLRTHLAMQQVHVLAPVRFTHAALPNMIARHKGSIINVSSIGALIPNPGDATYCASKAYLKVFTETLHAELTGTGVRVQVLIPGFTNTQFHDAPQFATYQVKSKIPKFLWMNAEAVVRESLDALQRDQATVIPGFQNRAMIFLANIGFKGIFLHAIKNLFHTS